MEMSSACAGMIGNPRQRAEEAIRKGQVQVLREALDASGLQENAKIQNELLELLWTEGDRSNEKGLAEVLLSSLADPRRIYSGGKYVLHAAAERGRSGLLRSLLEHHAAADALTTEGETGLHSAVRGIYDGRSTEERALECIKILVEQHSLNVDVRDDIGGWTAIHFAASHGYWSIVQYLISKDAHIDITVRDKKARDLINKYRPDLIVDYPVKEEPPPDMKKQLFDMLGDQKENDFIATLSNNRGEVNVNATNGKYTLLQCAVWNGLTKAVRELLELKADVNATQGEPRTAALLATHRGHADILEQLLNQPGIDLSAVENNHSKFTALHLAILSKHHNIRCLQLLLVYGNHTMDINAQDFRGFTALHYAAKSNKTEAVELLLAHNASIFVLNESGEPPFFELYAKQVSEYLDERITLEGTSVTDESYALVFDYSFLAALPPKQQPEDKRNGSSKETTYVQVPSEGAESGAPSSLLREMDPLLLMADSHEHRALLNHSLIRSFLHLKWERVFMLFYINFLIYFVFTASLSIYIYCRVAIDAKNFTNATTHEYSDETYTETANAFWWITLVVLILLFIRETFQCGSNFWQYVGEGENWLEIILLAVTAVLLFGSTDFYSRHSLAAVAVLLAYTELVLLLGRHPSLATYITMFFRVSGSFVYFLLWYSLLVVAFGFSFYIIFQRCEDPEDCNDNFFLTLSNSLFKTVVMLTGEFEVGDIQFASFNVLSHIIFLLFLFFIAIVLLNLLNGLAVSDTQAIRDEAEVVCCVAQVKLFSKMENAYFWSWFASSCLLLSGRLPEKRIKVYLNKGNSMSPDVRHTFTRRCEDGAATGICCLRNTCVRKSCKLCLVFNSIVGDARAVVALRGQTSETQQLMQRMDRLERSVEQRMDRLEESIEAIAKGTNYEDLKEEIRKLRDLL